jgi:hypothetical protein
VRHVAEDVSYGSGVASKLVGNDPDWFASLAAQEFSKESFCGVLITMRLDQNVDDVAVLIHGTPQILLLGVDPNEDLIQVPAIAEPPPLVASTSEHNQDRISDTTVGSSHRTR